MKSKINTHEIILKQNEKEEKERKNKLNQIKKSHTCEEGGTHLRNSFWHLLMNLKNK